MSTNEKQLMLDKGWYHRKDKLPKVGEEVIFCSESLMTCGIGKLVEVGAEGQKTKELKWIKLDVLGRVTNAYNLKQIDYWRPNTK